MSAEAEGAKRWRWRGKRGRREGNTRRTQHGALDEFLVRKRSVAVVIDGLKRGVDDAADAAALGAGALKPWVLDVRAHKAAKVLRVEIAVERERCCGQRRQRTARCQAEEGQQHVA